MELSAKAGEQHTSIASEHAVDAAAAVKEVAALCTTPPPPRTPPHTSSSPIQVATSPATPSPNALKTAASSASSLSLAVTTSTTPQRGQHDSNGSAASDSSPRSADSSPATASSSTTAPARAIPQRRVKLYRLKDEQWLDLGTGNCMGVFIDPGSVSGASHSVSAADEGAWIVVSREGSEAGKQADVLLRSKVQSSSPGYGSDDDDEDDAAGLDGEEGAKVSDAGRYQRQQDTLIVWTDRQTEMEMALSFATASGCAEIWDFIKQARRWNGKQVFSVCCSLVSILFLIFSLLSLLLLSFSRDSADQVATSPSIASSISSPQPFPAYGHQTTRFPEVSLATIVQVETAIRALGRTASGREATAMAIVKGEVIQKLIRIQEEAEDLESLDDLHALCRVMQMIREFWTVSRLSHSRDLLSDRSRCLI